MGVNVGLLPVGAFISLLLAIILIVATVAARRRGHIHDRHVLVVIAAIIFVLIVYGMGFGVIQPW
jgi:predicted Na+-dependent transporter